MQHRVRVFGMIIVVRRCPTLFPQARRHPHAPPMAWLDLAIGPLDKGSGLEECWVGRARRQLKLGVHNTNALRKLARELSQGQKKVPRLLH